MTSLASLLRSGVAAALAVAPGIVVAQVAEQGSTLTAFETRKVETLLRDRLPCLGCHSIGTQMPGGALGPDLTDLRQRRSAAEIARMIEDPQHAREGTVMPDTPMPDEWRRLVIRYFGGAPSAKAVPVVRGGTPADTSGAQLYARFCAGCHGARGGGDGPTAARLKVRPAIHAAGGALGKRPDDSLYDTIAGGGWIMNRSALMPAYGTTLAPAQI